MAENQGKGPIGDPCPVVLGQSAQLSAFLKDFYLKDDFAGKSLSDELQQRFLLKEEDAKLIAQLTAEEYKQRTSLTKKVVVQKAASKKESRLSSMLGQRAPRQRKQLVDTLVDLSNAGAFTESEYVARASKKLGVPTVTPENAKRITELVKASQEASEGRPKEIARAELMAYMANLVPKTLGDKINTLHTGAMLSNPATSIRNVLGNTLYGEVLQGISNPFAVLFDMGASLFTKQRTIDFRVFDYPARIAGFLKGAKYSAEDLKLGIDTSAGASKYGLQGSVFSGDGLGDKLGKLFVETPLNLFLKLPDRAFSQAAYDGAVVNLTRVAKMNKLDLTDPKVIAEIEELAKQEALRATFQDSNKLSDAANSVKRALNHIPVIPGVGLGDVFLKFSKTPANIISRAIDLSPLSPIAIAYRAGTKQLTQKELAERMGDLVVAAGLTTIGMEATKLGILTNTNSKSQKERENNSVQGLSDQFSLNVSALGRWMNGTLDPKDAKPKKGDLTYTYSWAMPIAAPLMIGQFLAQHEGKKTEFPAYDLATSGLLGVVASGDAITSMGMLRNLEVLTGSYDSNGKRSLPQGLLNVILDIPGSFVPSAVNAANFLGDNVQKETRDANPIQARLNTLQSRIPVVRDSLPVKYGVTGKPIEKYVSNDPFTVFLNPGFASVVKSDKALDEVNRLYDLTKKTGVLLPSATAKVSITRKGKAESIQLNAKQISDYQKMLGTISAKYATEMTTMPLYRSMKPEDQAKVFASVLSEAHEAAKRSLFRHSPRNPSALSDYIYRQQDSLARIEIMEKVFDTFDRQFDKEDYLNKEEPVEEAPQPQSGDDKLNGAGFALDDLYGQYSN